MQYFETPGQRTVVGHLSSSIEEVPTPFAERYFKVTDVYGGFQVGTAAEIKVGAM